MPAAALRSAPAVLQSPPPASGHDPAFRAADPSCPCPGAAPRADAISGTTSKMKMPFAAKSIRSAYGKAPAAAEIPGSCPVPGVGQVRAPGNGLKAAGAPPTCNPREHAAGRPNSGNDAMFERRTDLLRLLAVAETGTIGAAAKRSNVTQPTLTRDIARLEQRFGGKLFERLPLGVRPTALGATAVERARRILAEIEAAERAIEAARSGRTGVFRVTATPPWIETVLARAAARLRETFPAVEPPDTERHPRRGAAPPRRRRLRPALRRHRHRRTLPAFLRRERFLDMTAGIVAWRDHPLFAGSVAPQDLARYPWIDFDWPAPASLDETRPSLAAILAQLRGEGAAGIVTVLRLGAAGLFALATGPWLAWLSTELLKRLPGGLVRPLPVEFGRYRYRSGFVARRSAEDLPPFRALEQAVRDTALGRDGQLD